MQDMIPWSRLIITFARTKSLVFHLGYIHISAQSLYFGPLFRSVGVMTRQTFNGSTTEAFGLPCSHMADPHLGVGKWGYKFWRVYFHIFPFSNTKMGMGYMGTRPNITTATSDNPYIGLSTES